MAVPVRFVGMFVLFAPLAVRADALATLVQASQEARAEAGDPDRQTPVRSGMGRVQALELADLLNASSMLATELLNAQLIDAKTEAYRGRPAHVVDLKLRRRCRRLRARHVKKVEKWEYARSGDRLVAVRYEENDHGGAFGEHSTSHVIEALRLNP